MNDAADTDEKITECIEKSLNYLSANSWLVVLKCEQRISIQHLVNIWSISIQHLANIEAWSKCVSNFAY